jgi:hypothetical protein
MSNEPSVEVLEERIRALVERLDRQDAANTKRWDRIERWLTWMLMGLGSILASKLFTVMGLM